MSEHLLLMEFLDESETFVLGFEIGSLWERIKSGECFNQQAVHSKNIAQIKLMCESFGIDYEIQDASEQWSFLTIKSII